MKLKNTILTVGAFLLTNTALATSLVPPTGSVSQYTQSINTLGWEVADLVSKEGKNEIYSPLSTSQALNMTYNGSSKANKVEMAKVLGLDSFTYDYEVLNYNNELLSILNEVPTIIDYVDGKRVEEPAYEFNLANSLWFNEDVSHMKVSPYFAGQMNESFQASLENIPFGQQGADIINGWVEKETSGLIKDLLGPDQLDPVDGRLVLANAMRIKASWKHSFLSPVDAPFQTPKGSVKAATLKGEVYTQFVRNGKYLAASLPTDGSASSGGSKISMYLVMPTDDKMKYQDLEEAVDSVNSSKVSALVNFEMPEFKIKPEKPTKLVQPFSDLGMKMAFQFRPDSFENMFESNVPVSIGISEIVQKAMIEVNQFGLEAAAATAVIMVERTSAQPPVPTATLKFNKPFFFVVRDNDADVNLFVGKLNNPNL